MNNLLAFSCSYVAMSLLALSYFGHYRTVLQQTPSVIRQRLLLTAGWVLLAVCSGLCILNDGVGYGLLVLFGLVAVCSLLIMMLLSFRPNRLLFSTYLMLFCGLLSLFF